MRRSAHQRSRQAAQLGQPAKLLTLCTLLTTLPNPKHLLQFCKTKPSTGLSTGKNLRSAMRLKLLLPYAQLAKRPSMQIQPTTCGTPLPLMEMPSPYRQKSIRKGQQVPIIGWTRSSIYLQKLYNPLLKPLTMLLYNLPFPIKCFLTLIPN